MTNKVSPICRQWRKMCRQCVANDEKWAANVSPVTNKSFANNEQVVANVSPLPTKVSPMCCQSRRKCLQCVVHEHPVFVGDSDTLFIIGDPVFGIGNTFSVKGDTLFVSNTFYIIGDTVLTIGDTNLTLIQHKFDSLAQIVQEKSKKLDHTIPHWNEQWRRPTAAASECVGRLRE